MRIKAKAIYATTYKVSYTIIDSKRVFKGRPLTRRKNFVVTLRWDYEEGGYPAHLPYDKVKKAMLSAVRREARSYIIDDCKNYDYTGFEINSIEMVV